MARDDAARRRSYYKPPMPLLVSAAILALTIASLILLQSFGIGPFGDDEPAVRDALEEDWGDEAEDDVTLPGERPAAFQVGEVRVMVAFQPPGAPGAVPPPFDAPQVSSRAA